MPGPSRPPAIIRATRAPPPQHPGLFRGRLLLHSSPPSHGSVASTTPAPRTSWACPQWPSHILKLDAPSKVQVSAWLPGTWSPRQASPATLPTLASQPRPWTVRLTQPGHSSTGCDPFSTPREPVMPKDPCGPPNSPLLKADSTAGRAGVALPLRPCQERVQTTSVEVCLWLPLGCREPQGCLQAPRAWNHTPPRRGTEEKIAEVKQPALLCQRTREGVGAAHPASLSAKRERPHLWQASPKHLGGPLPWFCWGWLGPGAPFILQISQPAWDKGQTWAPMSATPQ